MSARNIDEDLSRWARAHYSNSAVVDQARRMPGHSGISYGFSVVEDGIAESLILRVPPIGVKARHNLDVVRFAPVLRAAHAAGLPVPEVRWVSQDDRWFGTPYLMVKRVAGAPLPDVFEKGHSYPDRAAVEAIFHEAVTTLARIHAIDSTDLLNAGWATPTSREQDIEQWLPLLLKSDVPDEVRRTRELGKRLLASAPPPVAPRVVHGDFYSNNWMVAEGQLTAVLDWENATLNDSAWDLGWLATIYDRECWGPSRVPAMGWHPEPGDLYAWYEKASGKALRRPNWYQALMCYRLASITPSKVMLHRSGRRVDPVWEVFAEAIPYQLDRASILLEEDR